MSLLVSSGRDQNIGKLGNFRGASGTVDGRSRSHRGNSSADARQLCTLWSLRSSISWLRTLIMSEPRFYRVRRCPIQKEIEQVHTNGGDDRQGSRLPRSRGRFREQQRVLVRPGGFGGGLGSTSPNIYLSGPEQSEEPNRTRRKQDQILSTDRGLT